MAALKLPSTVFPQKTSSQNNREHFTQQGTPLQNRENFCSNGSYLHNREHIYTTGKKLTQPQWRSVHGRSQFHDRENSYVLLSSQGELPNTWALFEIKMQWIVSSLPRTRNRQESGDIPEQNGTAEACWARDPEVAGLKPFSCFHILTHSHQIKHSAAAQFSQTPGRKQIVITELISLVILTLCLSWLDSFFSQKLGINSCIDWDCSWSPGFSVLQLAWGATPSVKSPPVSYPLWRPQETFGTVYLTLTLQAMHESHPWHIVQI